VLECRVGIELAGLDVFVSATGGLRASEPAADLAIALAVASAAAGIALPESLLVVGEVGLAGEVREVGGVDRRLAEASGWATGRPSHRSRRPPCPPTSRCCG